MKVEMNQEMIGDAMDMGDANADADDVYNSILGEIGLEIESGVGTGVGRIATAKQPVAKV